MNNFTVSDRYLPVIGNIQKALLNLRYVGKVSGLKGSQILVSYKFHFIRKSETTD